MVGVYWLHFIPLTFGPPHISTFKKVTFFPLQLVNDFVKIYLNYLWKEKKVPHCVHMHLFKRWKCQVGPPHKLIMFTWCELAYLTFHVTRLYRASRDIHFGKGVRRYYKCYYPSFMHIHFSADVNSDR